MAVTSPGQKAVVCPLLSLKPQLKPFIQRETLASYGFGVDQGSHPMGESKLKRSRAEEMPASCAGVQMAGGRVQVRWDADGAATPMGQLAYFIEFLTLTGLWRSWQDRCPLS